MKKNVKSENEKCKAQKKQKRIIASRYTCSTSCHESRAFKSNTSQIVTEARTSNREKKIEVEINTRMTKNEIGTQISGDCGAADMETAFSAIETMFAHLLGELPSQTRPCSIDEVLAPIKRSKSSQSRLR